MAQQKTRVNKKEELERQQAEAYREEQRAKRIGVLKTVGAIILAVLLVIAFCFPAVTMLLV